MAIVFNVGFAHVRLRRGELMEDDYRLELGRGTRTLFIAILRDGALYRPFFPQDNPPPGGVSIFMGIHWGEVLGRLTSVQKEAARLRLKQMSERLVERPALLVANLDAEGKDVLRLMDLRDQPPHGCLRVYAGVNKGTKKGRLPKTQSAVVNLQFGLMFADLASKLV